MALDVVMDTAGKLAIEADILIFDPYKVNANGSVPKWCYVRGYTGYDLEDEVFLGKWLSNKTVENVTWWIRQSHVVVAEEAGTLLGVAAMTDTGKITLNYVSPHARFQESAKRSCNGWRHGRGLLASPNVFWRRRRRRFPFTRAWVTSRAGRCICFR